LIAWNTNAIVGPIIFWENELRAIICKDLSLAPVDAAFAHVFIYSSPNEFLTIDD